MKHGFSDPQVAEVGPGAGMPFQDASCATNHVYGP